MKFLAVLVLASLASLASSLELKCVVSDGDALSLLDSLNVESGKLSLVANVSNLGGVAGGHVLRRAISGYGLITLNTSMSSDENYFYLISANGEASAKFATGNLIYSLEMDGSDALVSNARDGRIWISRLRAPHYTHLEDQVELLAGNIMEFNALGCSAWSVEEKKFFVPIWDLQTNMCHMAVWRVGDSKVEYTNSSRFCNIVALEYWEEEKSLIALVVQNGAVSVQVLTLPLYIPSVTIPLGQLSNLPGASFLQKSVFFLVSGNSAGSEYELINVDVSTKNITRASLGNQMVVALATLEQ